MLTIALLAAGCSGAPQSLVVAPALTSDGTPEQALAADALAFTSRSHDRAAAKEGLERLLIAADGSAASVRALVVADLLSTPTDDAANTVAALDRALDGTFIETSRGQPRTDNSRNSQDQAPSGAALDIPISLTTSAAGAVKVYFVNGILNTSLDAGAGATALRGVLGGRTPVLYYNRSSLEPHDYRFNSCAHALDEYLARHANPDLVRNVVAQKETDADIRDLEAFRAAIKQSQADSRRAADEAASSVSGDLTIGAVRLACGGVDLAVAPVKAIASAVGHLFEAAANNIQLVRQRFSDTVGNPSPGDAALVQRVQADIKNGDRVVLVGHSQGTLFVSHALARVSEWYQQTYASGCPTTERAGAPQAHPAPVAALYIAPAFDPASGPTDRRIDSGLQRYVMLPGDVLNVGLPQLSLAVGPVPPNVQPLPAQDTWNPVNNHALLTYLLENSESRAAIARYFAELSTEVQRPPDPLHPCPPTPTPTAPPAPAGPVTLTIASESARSAELVATATMAVPSGYFLQIVNESSRGKTAPPGESGNAPGVLRSCPGSPCAVTQSPGQPLGPRTYFARISRQNGTDVKAASDAVTVNW